MGVAQMMMIMISAEATNVRTKDINERGMVLSTPSTSFKHASFTKIDTIDHFFLRKLLGGERTGVKAGAEDT